MAKLTKKYKEALAKVDRNKLYTFEEASVLLKEITYTKFDVSVDAAVHSGIDPRKADQMVHGVATLPHETGKGVRVLVLVTPDKEAEAKTAGADYIGLGECLQKIKDGWTDVDVIVTMPTVMSKLGPSEHVPDPCGLTPNPKAGTVTTEIGKAVQEIKAGKINFRADKTGIVHAPIGEVFFSTEKLVDNVNELLQMLIKTKPTAAKSTYMKSVYLSSTMSPSVAVDTKTI